MRFVIVTLLIISGFISFSPAQAQVSDKDPAAMPAEINFDKPPFWMVSYDELKHLGKKQKAHYLEKLGAQLRKVPGLEKTSDEQILEASEWSRDWIVIMRKLYQVCLNKTLSKTCEDVAQVRREAIDLGANKKLENRQAEEFKAKAKKDDKKSEKSK